MKHNFDSYLDTFLSSHDFLLNPEHVCGNLKPTDNIPPPKGIKLSIDYIFPRSWDSLWFPFDFSWAHFTYNNLIKGILSTDSIPFILIDHCTLCSTGQYILQYTWGKGSSCTYAWAQQHMMYFFALLSHWGAFFASVFSLRPFDVWTLIYSHHSSRQPWHPLPHHQVPHVEVRPQRHRRQARVQGKEVGRGVYGVPGGTDQGRRHWVHQSRGTQQFGRECRVIHLDMGYIWTYVFFSSGQETLPDWLFREPRVQGVRELQEDCRQPQGRLRVSRWIRRCESSWFAIIKRF